MNKETRVASYEANLKLRKYGWQNKIAVIDDGRRLKILESMLSDFIVNASGELILDNVMDEHHYIIDIVDIGGN